MDFEEHTVDFSCCDGLIFTLTIAELRKLNGISKIDTSDKY